MNEEKIQVVKIKSNYLNTEFEVSTTEFVQESGQHVCLISHDSLEDIVHNRISDAGVMYDYNVASSGEKHSVVICTMSDRSGRRIQAIGESACVNLNGFMNGYPTLMASFRAFDRAVIRYLEFPGKVYSDMEIPESEQSTRDAECDNFSVAESDNLCGMLIDDTADIFPDEEDTEMIAEGFGEVPIDDEEPISVKSAPVSVKTVENGGEKKSEKPVEKPMVKADNKPSSNLSSDESKLGRTIIEIGKYKGCAKTLDEIYSENPGWCSYIAKTLGKGNESANIIRKYLSDMGVSY